MQWLRVFLAAALVLPMATAQENASPERLPDADESVEGAPGFAFGGSVLLIMLIFGGLLAYVAWRQRRQGPRSP